MIQKKRSVLVLTLATAVLMGLSLAGCSDGGGSSPTDPGPGAGPPNTAAILGQVESVSDSSFAPGKAGVGGVTVRVRGTSVSAVTGPQGRFNLSGVPTGNRVLEFDTGTQSAALPIESVQPGERIELSVALTGSTVQVTGMTRGNGGPGGTADLALEMQPGTWNTNWAGSAGTVSALLTGEGFSAIDLDSIVLIGTDPEADPITPTRTDLAGNHVRAFFLKSEAIATLDDPQPGEVHTVTVELTVEGEPESLTYDVRVVGPGTPPAEASIDLEKSTNGQDADSPPGPSIPVGDPVEWEYVVTNTGDVPLTDVTVSDDQGVAVDCPAHELEPGESMTCTASGVAEAGQYANVGTATGTPPEGDPVMDQDPSHYFGDEGGGGGPAELTLDIQPDAWNTNWLGSAGTVSAKISGEGFEAIDLDSIVLIGTDPEADPLAASSANLAGNHVRARFPKSGAFETLDDPAPGDVHTIIIELTVDGEPTTLMGDIRVVGPPL